MITFESFHLSKSILSLLLKNKITDPTPIQQKLIPLITAGRDVIAQSETGSGKTLSFALPLIDKIRPQDGISTLVLAPTRELTLQISQEFMKFSHGKNIVITPIYGGVSISEQIKKLNRTNIIVGTPGRLLDLIAGEISISERFDTWCSTRRTVCWIWVSLPILNASCGTFPGKGRRFS